jgi:glutamate/tyrosine decarboxylase-like PLP-dependent enzyme
MISILAKLFRYIYYFPRRILQLSQRVSLDFLLDDKNIFPLLKIVVLNFYLLLNNKKNIGSLWNKATWISVFSSSIGNRYNLNNLGNVYQEEYEELSISKKIEKKVIEWNKKIINCNDINVEGYVSSGGTESNLFLMWMGREYLKKIGKSKPILLVTDFTHYSVSKSGRIMDIESQVVSIDKKSFGISISNLKKRFLENINKGKYLFLLPVTIGYSSTGASDDLNQVLELVNQFSKKYSKFNCFIWVDAAAQGLPKSFLEDNFNPFKNSLVKGYVVDFHKHGNASLPAGVVLYRKNLRHLIETKIPYLKEKDSTVNGSRPGSSPLAIWANIICMNENQWKNKFVNLEKKKNRLINQLQKKYPDANIVYYDNSLSFAVEVNKEFKGFSKSFVEEHSLVKCKINKFTHYKFHIQ